MNFFETIKARRSIRRFTTEHVPDEIVQSALEAAVKAPNSSNLQPWEFYWIKDETKKQKLVKACFSQSAAKTANHLIFAVARIDTWKRNRDIYLNQLNEQGKIPSKVLDYYKKVVPVSYVQGPLNILYLIKKPLTMLIGIFQPISRRPGTRAELFEVVTKTTALACQNFMLAISAQGFDTCPMEGYDDRRVKKILNLNRKSNIVMAIAVGKRDPKSVFGQQLRIPNDLVIHKI